VDFGQSLPASCSRAKQRTLNASAWCRGQAVKLYSYFRSSAAYRVRIALNLKNIAYEIVPIHLTRDGGRQHGEEFKSVNPQARVPALLLDDGEVLTQSLAIIDYLDQIVPERPFLPRDPGARARVQAVAQLIACDIHPLNNLAPLQYLKRTLGQDQTAIDAWYHHWILLGFDTIEMLIRPAPYAFGSEVTLADICLVPQLYNARRLKVPLERFPKIVEVDAACAKLAAFDKARPENQPDAE
jgi:maleylpyruvate isomerase